jgi:putative ABC transport system permease protein
VIFRVAIWSAANVCIVGVEVISQLFEKNINPLNQEITISGGKFKIVGLLEKKEV